MKFGFEQCFGRSLTKTVLKHWEQSDTTHLDQCVTTIASLGYKPHKSDRHSLHFIRQIAPSIQGSLGVNRWWTDDDGRTCIGASLCIQSRLLAELTVPSDPWFVPADRHLAENAWAVGYQGCVTAHLSHLRWAKEETLHPPAWPLSDDGMHRFAKDFQALFEVHVQRLTDDEALLSLLECVARYERPTWVKSDPPGFAFFGSFLDRLRTHLAQ
jgi:hypothetical protein